MVSVASGAEGSPRSEDATARARRVRTLGLGAWLASRGFVARAGLVLAALGALVCVAATIAMSRMDAAVAVGLMAVESSALAWGAGSMVAFGAAVHALRRDREQGVAALVALRGASLGAYVGGRVGGLVVVLALAVGGATLVAGLTALAVARPILPALRGAVAALAYALAFAATVAPVAMATLGARSRSGGYFSFLAVLVVPELLASSTAKLLPRGWHDVTSIPAALAAVRIGVAAPIVHGASLVRALTALTAVVAVSLLAIAARVRLDRPEDA